MMSRDQEIQRVNPPPEKTPKATEASEMAKECAGTIQAIAQKVQNGKTC